MASLREIFDRLNPLQGELQPAHRSFDAEAARARFEPKSPSEAEYEVYIADLWDSATGHSTVLFTGTEAACELYLETDPRRNCMRFKARIRPTGELISPELKAA